MKNKSASKNISTILTRIFITIYLFVAELQIANANPTYCIPQPSSYACQQMYLGKVKTSMALINFSDTIHPCPLSSYTDHSVTKTVTQHAGGAIKILACWGGSDLKYNVYVDWNNNGVFTDAGELVAQFGGTGGAWDSATFTVPALQPAGTYRLRIRGEDYITGYPTGPCTILTYGNTIDYSVIVGEATGVTTLDRPNDNSLIIYPNPLTSSSILQLNTKANNAEVVIYDVLGKEMIRRKMDGNKMEIERGSLQSGVYFVRVRTEEKQWVEKMVVQ
jgi:hypothetical protein